MSKYNEKYTKEEDNFLLSNYTTMSYKELGLAICRSEVSVNDRLHKYLKVKNKCVNTKWTDEEVNLLIKEYNRVVDLTKLFPTRSKSSISSKAQSLGLKKMNRGNFELDVDYFKNWNDDMAYYLGLIAADGNVIIDPKVFTLVLHRQDNYMLENIAKALKCERPIHKRKASKCNQFVVRSGVLVDDLINLGIVPTKSLKLDWLNVPEQYLKHFVRGYIDGDGSVSYHKRKRKTKEELVLEVSILGTENFLNGMCLAINNQIGLNILKTHKPKGFINGKEFRNISCIKYSCGSAIKLLEWLYSDSDLYLQRKKEKYLEYLSNR
jgi:hypothetical protein